MRAKNPTTPTTTPAAMAAVLEELDFPAFLVSGTCDSGWDAAVTIIVCPPCWVETETGALSVVDAALLVADPPDEVAAPVAVPVAVPVVEPPATEG